ncbi:hypothetical protein [Caulobacter segnis]
MTLRKFVLAALLLLATPAVAQEAKTYGVPEIAALGTANTLVVRVAFTDSNGQPAGLVSFIRAPGEEPRVEVRMPPANEWRQAFPPMTATISAATWRALVEDGVGFDIVPAPPPPPEPGKVDALALCMHPWSVTVETVDALGDVRRAGENACRKGAALRYGFALAKVAVEALPACAGLDAGRTRNAVTQLGECALLSGDRAAAAEAYNVWKTPGFARPPGPDFARPLGALFFDQAEVTWPGAPMAKGIFAASQAWVARGADQYFQPRKIIGDRADLVRMQGVIWTRPNAGADYASVPATLIWTRENGFGFRVRSFKPD